MSIEWVLVWVLVTANADNRPTTYSPPLKTQEDCERVRKVSIPKGRGDSATCIEVHILVPKAKP